MAAETDARKWPSGWSWSSCSVYKTRTSQMFSKKPSLTSSLRLNPANTVPTPYPPSGVSLWFFTQEVCLCCLPFNSDINAGKQSWWVIICKDINVGWSLLFTTPPVWKVQETEQKYFSMTALTALDRKVYVHRSSSMRREELKLFQFKPALK